MRLALCCMAVMLVACGTTEPASLAVPGYEYSVKLGETLHMVDDFSLEFTKVVNDSRCPKNVTCIWAGDAVIHVTAHSGAQSAVLELHTAGSQLAAGRPTDEGVFAGWRVILKSLEPWPVANDANVSNAGGEYTARLFAERTHDR